MTKEFDGNEFRRKVLDVVKAKKKNILDIGAGPLAEIAATEFGCNVTSIDIKEKALRKAEYEAEQKGIFNIQFENEDATQLSYPENSFDIVISYGALHHISKNKRRKFLSETFKVAKEKLVIAEYTERGFEWAHPKGEYERVNLKWLEAELKKLGKQVKKFSSPGKIMNVYVCLK